jgi:signal transduction histidine kinase
MSRFEIKIVAALLLIAIIPLGASVYLVGQVIEVSDRVAEGQTRRLSRPLERAAGAYRGLIAARKRTFKLLGTLLAQDAALLAALGSPVSNAAAPHKQGPDRIGGGARLEQLLGENPEIGRVELLDASGAVLLSRKRTPGFSAEAFRDLRLDFPLAAGDQRERGQAAAPDAGVAARRLRVTFYTPRAPFKDFRKLGQAQRATGQINRLRDDLGGFYLTAFLIMFGAVALLATGLGLFIARRTGRRVAVLAAATRKVAEGDLSTRVQLRTKDEVGDLARAFNEMVQQIEESGERITYLEKIGAWQEIARRLAHEIKNPLTPIQLAVQQLHSKYDGDDPRFSRLLDDARDIITEEVDGLRRLVQAFSAFAKLPSVQPEPVDINALVDDFFKSHVELQQRCQIDWTPLPAPCEVQVDRMLIKHVLYNLVENAIQAAEDADSLAELRIVLTVRRRPSARRLELRVADNGPGMDGETARQVFNPYFTTKDRGTGLGLAIVKKIILEHRGTIAFDSSVGGGTSFSLTLPLSG